QQKEALERFFRSQSVSVPIGVAFRHSAPGFQDAFETFKKSGVEKVAGFVLASFRSFVSLQWYHEKVLQGRALAHAEHIQVDFTAPFDQHPLYLEAQLDFIRELWDPLTDAECAATYVIYTAHSIPSVLCERSCLENQGP